MWRAIIFLCAALIVGVPQSGSAQYSDTDRQNPNEYTDEDSQPLRIIAYLVAPLGFVLEWGVARPLHYVATDTFLAPVFNGDTREPQYRAARDCGDSARQRWRRTAAAFAIFHEVRATQSPEEMRPAFDRQGCADRRGTAPQTQPIIQ